METEKSRICVLLESGKKMGVLGYNHHGTLGINLEVDTDKPVKYTIVDLPEEFTSIVMGAECTMAIAIDGAVWGWGNIPGENRIVTVPTRLNLLRRYCHIGVGNGFACLIDTNGLVQTIGTFVGCDKPIPTDFPLCEQVACSDSDIALVGVDGSLWTTQIGHGKPHPHMFSKRTYFGLVGGGRLEEFPKISRVACGDYHTLVLDTEGRIYSFGMEGNGQLGISGGGSLHFPTMIPKRPKFKFIWCAGSTSYVMRDSGEVLVFGWFPEGGSQMEYWTPTKMDALTNKKVIPGRNLVAYSDCQKIVVWDTLEFPGFEHPQ